VQRYPEYYNVIKESIDLKQIAMKIQKLEYASLTELEDDLQLLFKNAMQFNEPGSQIYKDAKTLFKLVKSKKYELEINKQARENRGSRNTRRFLGRRHCSADVSDLFSILLLIWIA
jgi:protein polybromo-1